MASVPSSSAPRVIKKTTPVTRRRSLRLKTPLGKSSEDLVVEEMRRHQFKATPVNRKILDSNRISNGIPIVRQVLKTTVPQPFSFATENRVKKKAISQSNESTETLSKTISKAVIRSRSAPLTSRRPLTTQPLTTVNKQSSTKKHKTPVSKTK